MSAEAPREIRALSPFTFQWKVENVGDAPSRAQGWRDDLYFSQDGVLRQAEGPDQDRLITSWWVGATEPLAPTKSLELQRLVSLPSDIRGSGYLFVVSDSGNRQPERNELNNSGSVAVTVLPPLPGGGTNLLDGPPLEGLSTPLTHYWEALQRGLDGFFDWAENLSVFEELDARLERLARLADDPTTPEYREFDPNVTLGSLFDGEGMRYGVGDLLEAAFNSSTMSASEWLAQHASATLGDFKQYLDDLPATSGAVVGGVNSVNGDLYVTLHLKPASVAETLRVELGGAVDVLGVMPAVDLSLAVQAELQAIASLEIPSLTLGISTDDVQYYDLTSPTAPWELRPVDEWVDQAFFVRLGTVQAPGEVVLNAMVNLADVHGEASLGFFGVQASAVADPVNPNIRNEIDAEIRVRLNNPDDDPFGRITLGELRTTGLSELVNFPARTASLHLMLGIEGRLAPTEVDPGAFEVRASATLDDPDLFDGTLASPNLSGLPAGIEGFSRVTSSDWLAVIRNFVDSIRTTLRSAPFALDVPFLGEETLRDLIAPTDPQGGLGREDLADAVWGELSRGLVAETSGAPSPAFSTAQELATKLAAATGLGLVGVRPTYNPNTKELTYRLNLSLQRTLAPAPEDPAFAFDIDLPPLAEFTASATVHARVTGAIAATLGLKLTPLGDEADDLTSATLLRDLNGGLGVRGPMPVVEVVRHPETNEVLETRVILEPNSNSPAYPNHEFRVYVPGRQHFDVLIDGAVTVGDVLERINNAQGNSNSVEASISADKQSLLLEEVTPSGLGGLRVEALEQYLPDGTSIGTSGAAEDLGILQADLDGNGEIVGRPLHGDSWAKHLYLENASVTASVNLMSNLTNWATGRIGFVDVAIGSGHANLQATTSVSIRSTDPMEPRITLHGLVVGLATNFASVVTAPTLNGTAWLNLENISADPGFPGASLTGASVMVTVPDLTDLSSVQATFSPGASPLQDLTTTAQSGVVELLSGGVAYLERLVDPNQAQPPFGQILHSRLPIVGRTIIELVDEFAGEGADGWIIRLRAAVEEFRSADVGSIQDLQDALIGAFGGSTDAVAVSFENRELRLAIDHVEAIAEEIPFNLNARALDLLGLGDLVQAGGEGQILLSGQAALHLVMGIDLHDPLAPVYFVDDETAFAVELTAGSSTLEFSAAIGPLGLFIGQPGGPNYGQASINNAALRIDVVDDPVDGRHTIEELLAAPFGLTSGSLSGSASATLPVYARPLAGGPPVQVGPNITLTVGDLGNLQGTTTLTGPTPQDFAGLLQGLNFLTGSNVSGLVDGLEYLISTIDQVLETRALASRLPIVGEGLAGVLDALEQLKSTAQTLRNAIANPSTVLPLSQVESILGVTAQPLTGPPGMEGFRFDLQRSGIVSSTASLAFDLGLPSLGFDVDGQVTLDVTYELHLAFGLRRDIGFFVDTSVPDEFALGIRATAPGFDAIGRLGFLELRAIDDSSELDARLIVDLSPPSSVDFVLSLADLTRGSPADFVHARLTGGADVNLNLKAGFGSNELPMIETDFRLLWTLNGAAGGPGAMIGQSPVVRFDNVRLELGEFLTGFARNTLDRINSITAPIRVVLDALDEPIPVISDLFGRNVSLLTLAQWFNRGGSLDSSLRFIRALNDVTNRLPGLAASAPGANPLYLGSFTIGGGSGGVADSGVDLRAAGVRVDQIPINTSGAMNTLPTLSGNAFFRAYRGLSGGGFSFPIIESPLQAFRLLLGQDATFFSYTTPRLNLGFGFGFDIPIFPPFLTGVMRAGVDLSAQLTFGYDTFGIREAVEADPTSWAQWDASKLPLGFFVSDVDANGRDVAEVQISGGIYLGAKVGVSIDLGIFSFDVSGGIEGGLTAQFRGDINGAIDDDDGDPTKLRLASLFSGSDVPFAFSGGVYAELRAFFKAEACIDFFFGDWCIGYSDSWSIARVALFTIPQQYLPSTSAPPTIASISGTTLRLHFTESNDAFAVTSESGELVVRSGAAQPFRTAAPISEIVAVNLSDETAGGGNDLLSVSLVGSPYAGAAVRFRGGSGDDRLTYQGTGSVQFWGENGDDSAIVDTGGAQPSAEVLFYGGADDDRLDYKGLRTVRAWGEAGDDSLTGGDGEDYLYGGIGDDRLVARGGGGELHGDAGGDSLTGGSGADRLFGGSESDRLLGGDGDDDLFGDAGDDSLDGSAGSDWLVGGDGRDRLVGGNGKDILWGHDVPLTQPSLSRASFVDPPQGSPWLEAPLGLEGGVTEPGADKDNDTLHGGNDDAGNWMFGGGGDDSITGGLGKDYVDGGSGMDSINGGPGDDHLRGFADDDSIQGGRGDDKLVGGRDSDALFGGAAPQSAMPDESDGSGNDVIVGDEDHGDPGLGEADLIDGGDGGDTLRGNGGADRIVGGEGADTIDGDAGDDRIYGGYETGDADALLNVLRGGNGDDEVHGDTGRDWIVGNLGSDRLFGRGGDDVLWGDEPEAYSSEQISAFGTISNPAGLPMGLYPGLPEALRLGVLGTGSDGADTIDGGGGIDWLFGGGGDDPLLSGGAEADYIDAGLGNDHALGGAGADWIVGSDGDDRIDGGGDNDVLWGDRVPTGVAATEIWTGFTAGSGSTYNAAPTSETGTPSSGVPMAADGDDTLVGGAGADWLYGLGGADGLSGGSGNDYIDTGVGLNVARGDLGSDRIIGGEDAEFLFAGSGAGGGGAAGDVNRITAGAGNDQVWGDAGEDVLEGASGSDIIRGGKGTDIIDGGADGDTLYAGLTDLGGGDSLANTILGGAGDDAISGDGGGDTVHAGAGEDVIHGNAGADILNGNENDDRVYGGAGNDFLYGGGDRDYLDGGSGEDQMFGGSGADVLLLEIPVAWGVQLPYLESLRGHGAESSLSPEPTVGDAKDTDVLLINGSGVGERIRIGRRGDHPDPLTDTLRVVIENLDESVSPKIIDAQWRSTVGGVQHVENIEQFQVDAAGGSNIVEFVRDPGDALIRPLDLTRLLNRNDQTFPVDHRGELIGVFRGGPEKDVLIGAAGRDMLIGGAGDDFLFGFGGDDRLWGDDPDDLFSPAYDGKDIIFTGAGNDDALGEGGDDVLLAGTRLRISGGPISLDTHLADRAGTLFVEPLGMPGNRPVDLIGLSDPSDAGLNRLHGGTDSDDLFGGFGADFMYGGDAGTAQQPTEYNTLYDRFNQPLESAAGSIDPEWVSYASQLDNVWYYRASDAANEIRVDRIEPGQPLAGSYAIYPGQGQVPLFRFSWDPENPDLAALGIVAPTGPSGSAAGLVSYLGAAGLPALFGAFDVILLDLRAGNDRVMVNQDVDKTVWIDGGAGNDTINLQGAGQFDVTTPAAPAVGNPGAGRKDVVVAGEGNDIISGGPGDDWLFGGSGDDVLFGGIDINAEDLLDGGADNDTFQLIPFYIEADGGGSEPIAPDRLFGGGGIDQATYVGTYAGGNQSVRDYVLLKYNSPQGLEPRGDYELGALVRSSNFDPSSTSFVANPAGPAQFLLRSTRFIPNGVEHLVVDAQFGNDVVIGGIPDSESGIMIPITGWGISRADHALGATIPSIQLIGGADADFLIGSGQNDSLYGDGDSGVTGADYIRGLAGSDLIEGGDGSDFLTGDDKDSPALLNNEPPVVPPAFPNPTPQAADPLTFRQYQLLLGPRGILPTAFPIGELLSPAFAPPSPQLLANEGSYLTKEGVAGSPGQGLAGQTVFSADEYPSLAPSLVLDTDHPERWFSFVTRGDGGGSQPGDDPGAERDANFIRIGPEGFVRTINAAGIAGTVTRISGNNYSIDTIGDLSVRSDGATRFAILEFDLSPFLGQLQDIDSATLTLRLSGTSAQDGQIRAFALPTEADWSITNDDAQPLTNEGAVAGTTTPLPNGMMWSADRVVDLTRAIQTAVDSGRTRITIRLEAIGSFVNATVQRPDRNTGGTTRLEIRAARPGAVADVFDAHGNRIAAGESVIDMRPMRAGTYYMRVFDPTRAPNAVEPPVVRFSIAVNPPARGFAHAATFRDIIVGGDGADTALVGNEGLDALFGGTRNAAGAPVGDMATDVLVPERGRDEVRGLEAQDLVREMQQVMEPAEVNPLIALRDAGLVTGLSGLHGVAAGFALASDLAQVTWLDASFQGLQTIQDIDHLKNLRSLSIAGNFVETSAETEAMWRLNNSPKESQIEHLSVALNPRFVLAGPLSIPDPSTNEPRSLSGLKSFDADLTVGKPSEGASTTIAALSPDARFVAFVSYYEPRAGSPPPGTEPPYYYLYDRTSGNTTLIGTRPNGVPVSISTQLEPVVRFSGDGHYLFYQDDGTATMPPAIVRRDLRSGAVESRPITRWTAYPFSRYFSVTGDGSQVVYHDPVVNGQVYLFTWGVAGEHPVSVGASGQIGNGSSLYASISGDGRYVAFSSYANDLLGAGSDTNGRVDLYVKDLFSGQVHRATAVNDNPASGGNPSGLVQASISHGGLVAFVSDAPDLAPDDTNSDFDVFTWAPGAARPTRASVSSTGAQGDLGSTKVVVTRDGSAVVFSSRATNLIEDDTNHIYPNNDGEDVFYKQIDSGLVSRISVKSGGGQSESERYGGVNVWDTDETGRHVVFASDARDLLPSGALLGPPNTYTYVHDRITRQTLTIDRSASFMGTTPGPAVKLQLSEAGLHFLSAPQILTHGVPDAGYAWSLFTQDLRTDLLSSLIADANITQYSVSRSGSIIAFATESALVPEDTNGIVDVYLANQLAGSLVRVTVAANGAQMLPSPEPGATTLIWNLELAGDGSRLMFVTNGIGLVPGDADETFDTFVWDPTGTGGSHVVQRVARWRTYFGLYGNSEIARLSENGRFVLALDRPAGSSSIERLIRYDLASSAIVVLPAGHVLQSNRSFDISADGERVALYEYVFDGPYAHLFTWDIPSSSEVRVPLVDLQWWWQEFRLDMNSTGSHVALGGRVFECDSGIVVARYDVDASGTNVPGRSHMAPALSDDVSQVAFSWFDPNFGSGLILPDGGTGTYLRDLAAQRTRHVGLVDSPAFRVAAGARALEWFSIAGATLQSLEALEASERLSIVDVSDNGLVTRGDIQVLESLPNLELVNLLGNALDASANQTLGELTGRPQPVAVYTDASTAPVRPVVFEWGVLADDQQSLRPFSATNEPTPTYVMRFIAPVFNETPGAFASAFAMVGPGGGSLALPEPTGRGTSEIRVRPTFSAPGTYRLSVDANRLLDEHGEPSYPGTLVAEIVFNPPGITHQPTGVLSPIAPSATFPTHASVTWQAFGPVLIDYFSIDDDDIRVTDSAGITVAHAVPGRPLGWPSSHVEYALEVIPGATLNDGAYYVRASAGAVLDRAGNAIVDAVLGEIILDSAPPTASLVAPMGGALTNQDLGHVEIRWSDGPVGSGIVDIGMNGGIGPEDVRIEGPGGVVIPIDSVVLNPMGTGTYLYRYGGFLPQGFITVTLLPGAVADRAGNTNAGAVLGSFTMDTVGGFGQVLTPSMLTVDPGYIRVRWSFPGGAALDTASINKDNIRVSVEGGIDLQMDRFELDPDGESYRYWYRGGLLEGTPAVWINPLMPVRDLAGNMVTANANLLAQLTFDYTAPTPTLLPISAINPQYNAVGASPLVTSVDVRWIDPIFGAAGVDAASIGVDDMLIRVDGGEAVAISEVADQGGGVWRYSFAALQSGAITIDVRPGAVLDVLGNAVGNPELGPGSRFLIDKIGPTAELITPLSGALRNTVVTSIDVRITDAGVGLAPATVDPSDFSVTGATVVGVQAIQDPANLANAFRLHLAAPISAGTAHVRILGNGIRDRLENAITTVEMGSFTVDATDPVGNLASPISGATATADAGFVEVTWADGDGVGIDPDSIDKSNITIAGVTINRVEAVGVGLYRYYYDGQRLPNGQIVIAISEALGAVRVTDRAGNAVASGVLGTFTHTSPIVGTVRVNGGEGQRSNTTLLTIQVQGAVNVQTLIDTGAIRQALEVRLVGAVGPTPEWNAWLALPAIQVFSWDQSLHELTIDLSVDGFGDPAQMTNSPVSALPDRARFEARLSTTYFHDSLGNSLRDEDGTIDGFSTVRKSTGAVADDFFRLIGDESGDGTIEFVDLNFVLSYYGGPAVNGRADFNFDGVVDFLDLNFLLGAYGFVLPPPA